MPSKLVEHRRPPPPTGTEAAIVDMHTGTSAPRLFALLPVIVTAHTQLGFGHQDGISCHAASQCHSGVCIGNTCAPMPSPNFAPCSANSDCLSNSCVTGACAAYGVNTGASDTEARTIGSDCEAGQQCASGWCVGACGTVPCADGNGPQVMACVSPLFPDGEPCGANPCAQLEIEPVPSPCHPSDCWTHGVDSR